MKRPPLLYSLSVGLLCGLMSFNSQAQSGAATNAAANPATNAVGNPPGPSAPPALAPANPVASTPIRIKQPPSVEIFYRIKAKRGSWSLSGQGTTQWQTNGQKYSLQNSARATLFGKIQDSSSQGNVDEHGLAPAVFNETRFRKETTTTTFARDKKQISFSEDAPSLSLPNGSQDRASIVWQLASIGRAHPERMRVGSEWISYVAGRRDAENWRFKVIAKENLSTPMGDIPSIHLSKAPPPDSQEQQVDLWLAPGMDWYPVQIRFKDADGDFVEQTVERMEKK